MGRVSNSLGDWEKIMKSINKTFTSRAAFAALAFAVLTPAAHAEAGCESLFSDLLGASNGSSVIAVVSTNVSPTRYVSFAHGVLRLKKELHSRPALSGELEQLFSDRREGGQLFNVGEKELLKIKLTNRPSTAVLVTMFDRNYALEELSCTRGHITGFANVGNYGQHLFDITLSGPLLAGDKQ